MSKRLSYQNNLSQSVRYDYSSKSPTDYTYSFNQNPRMSNKYSGTDLYLDTGTTFETSKYNSKVLDYSNLKKLPQEIANMRGTFNYSDRSRKSIDEFYGEIRQKQSSTYNKLNDVLRQTVDLKQIKKKQYNGDRKKQYYLQKFQKSQSNSAQFNQAYIKSDTNIPVFENRYANQTFSAGRKSNRNQQRDSKSYYLDKNDKNRFQLPNKKNVDLSNVEQQMQRMRNARQSTFNNIPVTQPLSFRKSTIGYQQKSSKGNFSKKNYQYAEFYTPKIEKSSYDERFDDKMFNKKNFAKQQATLRQTSSPLKSIRAIVAENQTNTGLQRARSSKNFKVSSNKFNEKTTLEDFILGKNLGQGKFGVVQMVQHKATGAIFAMKKVKKDFVRSNKLIDQFALQIKLQHCLVHPFILKIYGIFDDQTYVYLILQLMQQGNLYNYLKKHKKLPQSDIGQKIKYVSEAIKHIHEQGIAHRDIKPQNIMLSNNVCKLADFGWATFCDQRRKTYCGTCDYVAPEILQGSQYDMTVDLWCIGVLTYELVTGKPPFYHSNQRQTMKRIKQVSLTYPQTISQNLNNFIDNLIKKNPEERMSADQILQHPFLKDVQFN